MTREGKRQSIRKSLGKCIVAACFANIDSSSKCFCTYHLNRDAEKRGTIRAAKVLKRLELEQEELNAFILQRAGFKTRTQALQAMHILKSLLGEIK